MQRKKKKKDFLGLQGFARHRYKCFQKLNNTRQTTRHKLYKQSKSKGYRVCSAPNMGLVRREMGRGVVGGRPI